MPTHVTHIGPLGPLIGVGINVDPAQALLGLGGSPRSYTALWDTGSSITAISPTVQRHLHAQVVGRHPVSRPNQTPIVSALVSIRLKFDGHLAPYPWFDLTAVIASPATQGVDVLVGQDVLSKINVYYHGPLATLVLVY